MRKSGEEREKEWRHVMSCYYPFPFLMLGSLLLGVTGCFGFVYYDSKNCKSSKGYIKLTSMIETNELCQTVLSLYCPRAPVLIPRRQTPRPLCSFNWSWEAEVARTKIKIASCVRRATSAAYRRAAPRVTPRRYARRARVT